VQAQSGIDVFEIAVVADIDRCAGVNQVGEKHVEVEVLHGIERGVGGVGEQAVVLRDEAQRELFGELVVPLRADDVIVVDRGMQVVVQQAIEDVGVVDGERAEGMQRERLVDAEVVSFYRQLTLRDYDIDCSLAEDLGI